jgi:hypothetical protein
MRVTNHNTAWKGSTAWMEDAACSNAPRAIFFPQAEDLVPKPALALCNSCTVKDDCLDFALRNPSLLGCGQVPAKNSVGKSRRQRRRINRGPLA